MSTESVALKAARVVIDGMSSFTVRWVKDRHLKGGAISDLEMEVVTGQIDEKVAEFKAKFPEIPAT